jgi:hypothetical protein
MGNIPPALLTLINSINRYVINPLIVLGFAVAMIVFLWGVFNYVKGAGDPAARKKGRDHILWSIVGFAIMFTVFGIMTIISNSVGGPTGSIMNIRRL